MSKKRIWYVTIWDKGEIDDCLSGYFDTLTEAKDQLYSVTNMEGYSGQIEEYTIKPKGIVSKAFKLSRKDLTQ